MGNTILLADKSITIQKIVQLTFADDNFNIHTVNDGQAALDIIPQIRPDLILADISLPIKNGYELCLSIRKDDQLSDFSSVPVILLAGIYETMDEERSRQVEERVQQVGANDFLSKPFDPQLLISKVKQYLSTSRSDDSSRSAASAAVFAQEPDGGINLFDTDSVVKPPEDNEKTMMLPGGPFGTMFASEPTPYEEEVKQTRRDPSEIEAAKPVNEMIFEEDNFAGVELGTEQEDGNLFNQATLKIEPGQADNGRFSGRDEQEFEYRSGPVLEPPSGPAQEPPGSIPFILPSAEDPFSDVFQEPSVPWSSSSVSEEDSPFGVPEPPPPPAPAIEEVPAPVESKEDPAFFDQAESAAPVETFDDTWPGVPVRPNMTPAVEELFESEPRLVSLQEDAEELQPDLSDDSGLQEDHGVSVATPVAPGEPVSAAAVSDELIDKIAERVLNKLSERIVSEIVWQVVPDLAEKMIRRELEKLHAAEE